MTVSYFLIHVHGTCITYFILMLTGVLGALDPYKHKVNLGQIEMSRDSGAVLSEYKVDEDSEQGNGQ